MIERWIQNEQTLKRWRRFKQNRIASGSLILLIAMSLLSISGSFIANNRPIIMKYNGSFFIPSLQDYHPSKFGFTDQVVMDYHDLKLGKEDWALWPFVTWDAYESNKRVDTYPSPPTKENLFGTDDRGRDVFARLLYGYRYSMAYALLTWFVTFAIGVVLGGTMGFLGGKVDMIGQRAVEILSTVPQFLLLIIVVSIFQPTLLLLVLLSSFFGWIFISYYVRGEFLKLRKREFVEAARALGGSRARQIFLHILPNALGPVLTFSPFVIASNIVALASLDFLGFGLTPPTPSWGELLSQAEKYFTISWWLALYPSLALFSTLILLSLVGDGVRDAFDPKKT